MRHTRATAHPASRLVTLAVIGALAAAALALAPGARAAELDPNAVWVSPSGSDAAPGTQSLPIATLSHALKHADAVGRRTVYLVPGEHRSFRDQTFKSQTVTVSGVPGEAQPTLYGGEIFGGNRVTFRGIVWRGQVTMSNHPVNGYGQVAHDIVIENGDFQTYIPNEGNCIVIRNGSRTIRIRDNRFHDCRFAITGPHDGKSDPSQRIRSSDLVFERNWIGPVRSDGFQFGHWEDVTIRDNVIDRQYDPSGIDHTDGIQVMGDVHRLRIENNVVSNGGQLVFLQDALGGNSDVTLANNLIYNSGNYAVKASGTSGLRILGNTIWDTRYGGVLLRANVTNAVVVNNAMQTFGTTDSPEITLRDYSYLAATPPNLGPHEIVGTTPGFLDRAAGDYRLASSSPLIGRADMSYATPEVQAAGLAALGCQLPAQRSVGGSMQAFASCGSAP